MRVTLLFVVLAAVILAVSAYPYPEINEGTAFQAYATEEGFQEDVEYEPGTPLIRAKRATCDLLSGFGVDHSACAAHCILIGRKGGYCNNSRVCVCRN